VRRPTNPGEPDRRTELLREGVSGRFDVDAAGAVTDLGTPPARPAMAARRAGEIARRALLERLRAACGGPGPTAALLGCLLFNDRSGLDQATIDAFRDSGTAHLLSVSGLHVVLLAAAARRLARFLVPRRARRRLAMPSLLLLLSIYCGLCRFDTPVVRAAVFLAAAEAARSTMRRPSPLDALAAAAALVVSVDPVQVLDPGFQLSFAAVAGLALLTRGLRSALFPALALYRKFPGALSPGRLRFLERFATALSTSLAASAATAPIVAAVFGRLQPAAPVSNLVAVPLAAFLVPLAAALALLGGCAAWLTAPFAAVAVAPLRLAVDVASSLPGATIETGRPPPVTVLVSVALLCVAAWWIRRRPRAGAVCVAVSWLVLAATQLLRGGPATPEIVALDVGHGLCVLARSGRGGDVLFDAGGHVPGIGRRSIVPALRAMGVRRLGCVFLSHQDADHCSALPDLLAGMSVGEVVVSPGFGADPLPGALVAICRVHGVPVTVVARGDAWMRRGVTVRVLSPCLGVAPVSDNESSIVAHVTVGDRGTRLTALIPGDVEGAALRALASDPTAPPARVLLLPHHGRGDAAWQLALARRLGADVLVASTSAAAPTRVAAALITGRDGAVRVRAGETPATFPWREP
jgi:competence protein ComEC